MNNVGEKYLPIGTVVMLKGGSKRVMITGFCSMAAEDEAVMFDYSGCMYPEGFLSSDQTALFNHEQIERVYHLGLVDEEEQKFKSTLNVLVAQMNKGVVTEQTEPVQPVAQSEVPVQPVVTQVPPVGPGLPRAVAPVAPQPTAPVQPAIAQVPPVGPGLPGYVAPIQQTMVAPVQPQTSSSEEAPAGDTSSAPNYKFDENGILISA